MNRIRTTALLALLAATPAAAAFGADVVSCGQSLSESGRLVGDLDCSGHTGFAVIMTHGGSLDLAGFTLTARAGIFCSSEGLGCTVTSSVPGGAVLGVDESPTSHGIWSKAALKVENLTVSGFGGIGLYAFGPATIDNCVISENRDRGVFSAADIRVYQSSVIDNGIAVGSPGLDTNPKYKVLVRDSTIGGSGSNGIEGAGIVSIRGSFIVGNGADGIAPLGRPGFPAKVKLRDSSVSGNGDDGIDYLGIDPTGVQGRLTADATSIDGNAGDGVRGAAKTRMKGGSANGNGVAGIRASNVQRCQVKLRDTQVTGNGEYGAFLGDAAAPCVDGRFAASGSTMSGNHASPGCGATVTCADVASTLAPRLASGTTCEHSYVAGSGSPGSSWNVCSLD